jgi:hypothetical protein
MHANNVRRHHVGRTFRTSAVVAAVTGPSLSTRIVIAILSAAARPVVHFSPTLGFIIAEP